MSGIPAGPATPDVPDWAPTVQQVADYLPHRTILRSTTSTGENEDNYRFTWDETTTPPGTTVERLIANGVGWVLGQAIPLNESLFSSATLVAILHAAAAVERSWPNDDQSLQRANDLEKRMDKLLASLIVANDAANTPDPGDPDYGIDVAVPYWSFPPADPRYDSASYF